MLTVGDLLRDLDVRLLAGERGLHLPVRWVHISELLDPTPWLSGGELLLTTGMQLDTEDQQREFAARLADHHLAGLGFGTGFKHAAVPPPLLEVAAEREFPVFEVPYEVPFIAVTEAAFTQLVNEQYAVLRRALAAQERLERIVLSERGLDALVGALATLIGAAVVVFDARGEPLQQHAFRRAIDPEAARARSARRCTSGPGGARRGRSCLRWSTATRGSRSRSPPTARRGRGGGRRRAGPGARGVARRNQGRRPAVGLRPADAASGGDDRRARAAALAGRRRHRAPARRRRARRDRPRRADRTELAAGSSRSACPSASRAIVLSGPARGAGRPASVEAALWAALREEAAPALVASVGTLACALVPGGDDDELFALGDRVARRPARSFRRGPGRASGGRCPRSTRGGASTRRGARWRRSRWVRRPRRERQRVGAGVGVAERPRVATYRDLGSFQLLLSLQDDEALRLFCDSILGPIEASEGPYGGELMRSLEAFIEENGQWERAARRLYCHRHTLRYRIRRVEELTGRNLGSARDRIEFWLALRGRQLVS